MHNSCAASDRRRLFSNLWYHIKNDSLCNRRFMDCMWCGFIDPELDIKKRHSENTDRRKRIKSISTYMAMLLIYSILFKRSFLISTILLGVATLAMTGTKKKLYYVIVIAMVVVLYLLFAKVLHIQLP